MLHRDCEKVRGEIRNQIKVSPVNEKKIHMLISGNKQHRRKKKMHWLYWLLK